MGKKTKKSALTGLESAQRRRFLRSEQDSDDQESSSVLMLHKTYTKRVRKRIGLSKYQMLWLSFGKGLVIVYALAFFLRR